MSGRPATFGRVNPGWTPRDWAARCRYMAFVCVGMHPDKAEVWLEWSFAVCLTNDITSIEL